MVHIKGHVSWYVSVYLVGEHPLQSVFSIVKARLSIILNVLPWCALHQCMGHIIGTQCCTSSYRVFLYCLSKRCVSGPFYSLAHGVLYVSGSQQGSPVGSRLCLSSVLPYVANTSLITY